MRVCRRCFSQACNLRRREYRVFEAFCHIFQILVRPVQLRSGLATLRQLIINTLVEFERMAHPAHKTSGQEHYLLHVPRWMEGEGALRDAWVTWQEREMGDAKHTVHSRRHPETNLQQVHALQTAVELSLQHSRTAAGAAAYLSAKPAYVYEFSAEVRLSEEVSAKHEAVQLSQEESVNIYKCLLGVCDVFLTLRRAYEAAHAGGRTATRSWQQWARREAPGLTEEQAHALDADAPTHARKFRAAEVRGMRFRAHDADVGRKSFARGVVARFASNSPEGVVYHGEVLMFYVVEFMGARYALFDAKWYARSGVERFEELGLNTVTLAANGSVLHVCAVKERIATVTSIIDQFFVGAIDVDAQDGPADAAGGGLARPGRVRRSYRRGVLFPYVRTSLRAFDGLEPVPEGDEDAV